MFLRPWSCARVDLILVSAPVQICPTMIWLYFTCIQGPCIRQQWG